MALRAPYTPMHAELDAFLFAQLGEDKSGMAVTVASAIARSGIDPWQEAARIAGLSRVAAIQVLLPMIARSSELVGPVDPQSAADRLVRLLPRRVLPESRPSSWTWKVTSIPPVAIWLTCLALSVGLLFWTMKESATGIDHNPAGFSSSRDISRNP